MRCVISVLLLCSVVSWATANVLRDLPSFKEHEIVPDVLSAAPAEILSVTFPNGVQALEGNELTPDEVTGVPTLKWNSHADKFYTLIMCDADAPSRVDPEGRSFLHWLVVNIPGDNVNEGETITNIINSHPSPTTGLHRYIFLVYEQPNYMSFEEDPSDEFERRVNFEPEEFSKKYNMGVPVAGNFYLTETIDDEAI